MHTCIPQPVTLKLNIILNKFKHKSVDQIFTIFPADTGILLCIDDLVRRAKGLWLLGSLIPFLLS